MGIVKVSRYTTRNKDRGDKIIDGVITVAFNVIIGAVAVGMLRQIFI